MSIYILDENGDPIGDGLEPITDGTVEGAFSEGGRTLYAAPRAQSFCAYRLQTFSAAPRQQTFYGG